MQRLKQAGKPAGRTEFFCDSLRTNTYTQLGLKINMAVTLILMNFYPDKPVFAVNDDGEFEDAVLKDSDLNITNLFPYSFHTQEVQEDGKTAVVSVDMAELRMAIDGSLFLRDKDDNEYPFTELTLDDAFELCHAVEWRLYELTGELA